MSFYDKKLSDTLAIRNMFLSMFKESIEDKKHMFREHVIHIIKEATMVAYNEITINEISNNGYSSIYFLYLKMKDGIISPPKNIDSKYLTKVYNIFASEDAYECFSSTL